MPSGRCGPGWGWWRRWDNSIPAWRRSGGCTWPCAWASIPGLVVVGEIGGGAQQEQLALGETPNLAARLQGLAAPNTLVISAATLPLLGGFFACQSLGTHLLKGFAQPLEVYQVLYESTARSRLEAAGRTGLTPLVGREQEVALLRERWAQVKDGLGQVVLLSGEAGIGKSRLVQGLTEQVASEPQAWLTPCQCSPYYQNTALYPMIELLERVALRFEREESPPAEAAANWRDSWCSTACRWQRPCPSSPPSSPSHCPPTMLL